MIEDERQANAAGEAALMDIQSRLQSDKQGLEQRVRQFQAALAKSGVESLRMCRELSDPNIAPWTEAEKQAGLATTISEDLSQSLRGPASPDCLSPDCLFEFTLRGRQSRMAETS